MLSGVLQNSKKILRLFCGVRERRAHGRHLITLPMNEDGDQLIDGQMQAFKAVGGELLNVGPILFL